MFEKGRHSLKEYFNNEMNSLRDFIHTPVSQAFRQVQKQLSATAFVVLNSIQRNIKVSIMICNRIRMRILLCEKGDMADDKSCTKEMDDTAERLGYGNEPF